MLWICLKYRGGEGVFGGSGCWGSIYSPVDMNTVFPIAIIENNDNIIYDNNYKEEQ